MSWVSWDKMTKPKSVGSLGFRDIQFFNQALVAKQAWKVLTKPGSLLAKILLGKYCHKQSLLTVNAPTNCSHGWRSLLHGRDLLKGYLGKAIGNGCTTSVWKDTWVSLTSQVKPYGPIAEADMDLTVSDLLTDDMQWNTKRLKEVLPLLVDQIKCIKPSSTGAEDVFIWQPTSSGDYTTKSGYAVAATKGSTLLVPNSDLFNWIRDVWATECSPKMKVFTWSIIQRALPLGENLQSRGIHAQAKCIRCNELETAKHIFFDCPFAKEVWSLILLKEVVHLATATDFKEAVVAFKRAVCLPPSGITGSILPWISWTLWTARNTLIFKKRHLTKEEVATKGLRLAREWCQTQNQTAKMEKSIHVGPTRVKNRHADPTIPTCKSDAAWAKDTQKAGLAWIINGPEEAPIKQGSTVQDFVTLPIVTEALALRLGLIAAVNLGLPRIKMLSENATLIRAINNDAQNKEIYGIVRDIQQISSVFVDISFVFLSRSQNNQADSLAKQVLAGSVSSGCPLG